MRVVVQRVSEAQVDVDNQTVGKISHGLLVLLGIAPGDTAMHADWMVEKLLKLRIFTDDEGKLNKSVMDVGGSILVVSQFTLYGDCNKGTRPSFVGAARPDVAIPLYEYVVSKMRDAGVTVETGEFGAKMDVSLVNDGPVTLVIEK